MVRASLGPAPIFQRKTWNAPNGRSLALLIYLKPVCQVFSPSETFAAETLSASRQLWAKDRLSSLSCIKCSPNNLELPPYKKTIPIPPAKQENPSRAGRSERQFSLRAGRNRCGRLATFSVDARAANCISSERSGLLVR